MVHTGLKGVGEIGLVPTAGAVANALYQFDGVRRTQLPMQMPKKKADRVVKKLMLYDVKRDFFALYASHFTKKQRRLHESQIKTMNENAFIKDYADLADYDSFSNFPLCGSEPLR